MHYIAQNSVYFNWYLYSMTYHDIHIMYNITFIVFHSTGSPASYSTMKLSLHIILFKGAAEIV